MVTGGDLSQWKDEPLRGQPYTHRFWSRQSPPSFHLDPNNLTRTRVTALLANEGADTGRGQGCVSMAAAERQGRKPMAAAGGAGGGQHGRGGAPWGRSREAGGGAEWDSANRRSTSATTTAEWRAWEPMGGRGDRGGAEQVEAWRRCLLRAGRGSGR